MHMPRLILAKRKVITAQAELDRVTQRRAANYLNRNTVAESHLQEPASHVWLTFDAHNLTM